MALKATALSGISLTPTGTGTLCKVQASSTVASDCDRNTFTTLNFRTAGNILVYVKPEVRMTQVTAPPLAKIVGIGHSKTSSGMGIRT